MNDLWDCHTHVFGAPKLGVQAPAGAYAPPVADYHMHKALRSKAGTSRAVVVQPSLYRTDHSVLLDALARGNGHLVGVASCGSSTTAAELRHLHERGVVALRFVGMLGPDGGPYPGTQSLQSLEDLRPLMEEAGLHAQIWADLDTCVSLARAEAGNSMPLVLDHLGGILTEDRPGTARFESLVEAIASGPTWIKLTFVRRSRLPGDYSDMREVVTALAQRVPDRILWGSDWPFVRLDNAPAAEMLLRRLREWLGETLFTRCLRDNPDRLFARHDNRLDASKRLP